MACWRGACRICKKLINPSDDTHDSEPAEGETTVGVPPLERPGDEPVTPKATPVMEDAGTKAAKEAAAREEAAKQKAAKERETEAPDAEDLEVFAPEISGGEGWKTPKDGQPVLFKLQVMTLGDKGEVIHTEEVEFLLGSKEVVPVAPDYLNKAIPKLRKGATASWKCDAACIALAARRKATSAKELQVALTLTEICEERDVLPGLCGEIPNLEWKLIKRTLKEGEPGSAALPADGSKLSYKLESLRAPGGPLLLAHDGAEIFLGNGTVCEALEFGLLSMRRGERSRLTAPWSMCTATMPPRVISMQTGETCEMVVELVSFERGPDPYRTDQKQLLKWTTHRKEIGTQLLSDQRHILALARYRGICDIFAFADSEKNRYSEEMRQEMKALVRSCRLNSALCLLQLKAFRAAFRFCDEVLAEDPNNVKALYRKAQAASGMRDYKEALKAVKQGLKIEPANAAMRKLFAEFDQRRQVASVREKKKIKKVMQNACHEELLSGGRDAEELDEDMHGPAMMMEGIHPSMSPLEVARKKGDPEIIKLLEEASVEQDRYRIAEEYGMSMEEAAEVQARGSV